MSNRNTTQTDGATRQTAETKFHSPFPAQDAVLDLIGDTPLVQCPGPELGTLYCKLETENPTGSMKDRVAMGIISEQFDPEEHDAIVEASSGNTAGSVALVANRLGVDCHVTCPESTSETKIGYMEAFGATVHECPDVSEGHPDYYHRVATELADEHDAFFVNQYYNPGNPESHYQWTGPELWSQAGPELTHVVCPMGTGGTLSGIARYLKEQVDGETRDVTVVGVDAEKSNISTAFYDDEAVEYDTEVEGLGKGHELPTMWFDHIDEVRTVTDEEAFEQARRTARERGLLVGPSSGAALSVALDICTERPDATVVSIVCDGGEQYFDTVFTE